MHWTTTDIPDQSGRVAVVTGANSGIGFETARGLTIRGATVVLGCRSVPKGTQAIEKIIGETPDAHVELIPLDLSSLQSVRDFTQAFTSRYDKLDLLINNAGVMMPPRRTETATAKGRGWPRCWGGFPLPLPSSRPRFPLPANAHPHAHSHDAKINPPQFLRSPAVTPVGPPGRGGSGRASPP